MAADTISFARGAPSADILPKDAVREAAATALGEDWQKALSYGTGIGHPGLCEWIAARHGGLDTSQVMIANGSLEAGWMLFDHLLEPGDEVVVEQPSYDRTLLMLEKLGVDRIGIPLEADGIEVSGLEQALADGHRTRDLGGEMGCAAFGAAVRKAIDKKLACERSRKVRA